MNPMTLPRAAAPEAREGNPVHEAETLTAGGERAAIRLDDRRYRLRITRRRKLLLTN